MTLEKIAMTQRAMVEEQQARIGNQKWTQYLAAFIATIGGFIAGTALGWTAPAGPMMENNQYSFVISNENLAWIGACMPLGAMLGCPVTAGLVDKLGRKNMMIMLCIPTLVGWAMMIWAESVAWICAGRLLTGFASGSLSVIVPLYTSEIAEKEIRGTLGTYFQLQVTGGILFTYVIGSYFDVFGLTIICAIIPIAYVALMVLIPESPNFHLMKGNVEKARLSLRYFRGPYGTVDQELSIMQDSLAKTERERVPLMEAFQTTPAKRGLFIGLGVMLLQQFSGCNAVIFYATFIFKEAGSAMEPNTSTIIVGIMSVIATYVSTLIVDRLGRKILLLSSIIVMAICTLLIGAFFYMKANEYDVSSIGFIPLTSMCVFIILFSLGFGPIPWMLIGEIFPAQIKGTACSVACMANWFFAFIVTKFFSSLVSAIHIYNTFWLFTLFSILGTFFVICIVPETKGKTMDEIQEMLGAGSDLTPPTHANASIDTKGKY
ncbi:facilitated trehalose transporter Tret1-like [Metopolophium dirhodum]|uniref:facilitated trehalose transporter Tret1-like n=1 Tax=Metopolophium dirhodum TaxID=44670 RepID=UPI00298F9019|nr:facilitated trehalose transporter Tret1-like [Metopolophium dirhodum]XP_060879989.1 facilitated trehalose transporter Tret1-like [Metopolophium dirhodum]XP_060879990.1 facilitated trehalose transporter Tret1-like [Metopolophium dirhodum]XP_060879991.1 facilitated trehalose transporter Tret1-like [Metopolophium dirhodum]